MAVRDQVRPRISRRPGLEPGHEHLRRAPVHLRDRRHERDRACHRAPGGNRGRGPPRRTRFARLTRSSRHRHRAPGGDPERRLRNLGPVRAGAVGPAAHRNSDHRPPRLGPVPRRCATTDQPVHGGAGARGDDPSHAGGGVQGRDPRGPAGAARVDRRARGDMVGDDVARDPAGRACRHLRRHCPGARPSPRRCARPGRRRAMR